MRKGNGSVFMIDCWTNPYGIITSRMACEIILAWRQRDTRLNVETYTERKHLWCPMQFTLCADYISSNNSASNIMLKNIRLYHNTFNGGQHYSVRAFRFPHPTQRLGRDTESRFGQIRQLTQVRAPPRTISWSYFRWNWLQLITLCYKIIHRHVTINKTAILWFLRDYSQWSLGILIPDTTRAKDNQFSVRGHSYIKRFFFFQIFPNGHWLYWSQIQPE